MKKVALIQNRVYFTPELKDKYLGNIPLLTSSNIEEIYNFIKINMKINHIYKYVLHVNSRVLGEFIDYIYDKKQNSMCERIKLEKCTFISTYSNADSIRAKNIEKNTNIYFALSPISTVLNSFVSSSIPNNKFFLVVSDSDTPYYNQVYNTNIVYKYKVSQLTLQSINDHVSRGGGRIVLSLDTREEYNKVIDLITASNQTLAVFFIEPENFDIISRLKTDISNIYFQSSGVSLSGDTFYYSDLNTNSFYENCAAVLINEYKRWKYLIKRNVISISPANHGEIDSFLM
jgi:hypothetical protein